MDQTLPTTAIIRSRLPYRLRLILGYAAILLLLALMSLVVALQINQIIQANQELERETHTALAAEELSKASLELVVALDDAILKQDVDEFTALVLPARERLQQAHLAVQALIPETTALDFTIARLTSFVDPMITQATAGSWELVKQNRATRLGESINRVSEEMEKLVAQSEVNQALAVAKAQEAARQVRRNLLIALAAAVLVSLLAAWTNIRSLTDQMGVLIAAAGRLAAGELDQRVAARTRDEIGALGTAFNRMAAQLQASYANLEAGIAERTRELESLAGMMRASAEVARAATTVLDPEALQAQTVELITRHFGFYHAGIFMLDESGQTARLNAASSPGGQHMLARGHRLNVGQGLVGTAIQQAEARAATVSQDSDFVYNPDLAETRSEAALPLRARGRIIGALDVQSTQEGAFTAEVLAVLQSLADQVALALDNARLFQESQQRLEEVRRLYGEYGRKVWQQALVERASTAYRYSPYTGVTAQPKDTGELREILQRVRVPSAGAGVERLDDVTLAVPLRIRDQVIGVLKVRKPSGSGGWTDAEIEMLNTIVEQLAVALEGARLYQETQRRAERERLVGEVTSQIRETLDLETVLKTAAQQIRDALGLPEVLVRLAPENHRSG